MEEEKKDKRYLRPYDFIPSYHKWVTMSEQKGIVEKLENITKDKKS